MKKSLVRAEEGATAIEFALLAIPYIFLMVGIIELAIMFAAAALVEGATNSASRLIRTGQLQQGGGDPEAVFRDALCDYARGLVNCNDMTVEVITLPSFAGAAAAAPQYDEAGALVPQGFDAGGSNDKVLVRTGYTYDMLTPFVGQLLAGNAEGKINFVSTIVLQTEPYTFEDD